MRAAWFLVAAALVLEAGSPPTRQAPSGDTSAPRPRLSGRAILPADTFAPGPPSGAFIRDGARAQFPPFQAQPVQGISSIWPDTGGWFWALVDNGFGTKLNSPDFLLRIYRLRPLFDEGRVEVDDRFIQLSDPDRLVPFHIVHEESAGRLLTGADFDPESMVRMPDGTFWIGDEFGPFLLHVSAGGRLLAPPVEAAGIRSPDHPLLPAPNAGEKSQATVGRSRGFEGLAPFGSDGMLVALLEGGLFGDEGKTSRALEFNPSTREFTGREWVIPFEREGHAFTELVQVAPERVSGAPHAWEQLPDHAAQFLLIERDDGHGPAAKFKQVLLVGLSSDRRADGTWASFKLGPAAPLPPNGTVDLLDIADPDRIAGAGERFRFPYITTEALWPVWPDVIIVNDNNYPATGGRHPDRRDPTEFIRVRFGARR
jgi:hypothetical protein